MDPEESTQFNNRTPVLSSEDSNLPLSTSIPAVVIYGILIATTVIGNLFVIISYFQDRKLRQRPANLIILNLAFADLIVGLVPLTVNLTIIVSGRWLFGEYFCRLYRVIDYLAVYVSVVMIVFISIDRYLLVTKPIKHRLLVTRKRVRYAIMSAWITYFTVFVLLSFGWTTFGGQKETMDYSHECLMEYLGNPFVTLTVSLIGFFIPFSSVAFLNVLIFVNIKRQFDKFQVITINRNVDEKTEYRVNQECPANMYDVKGDKDDNNHQRRSFRLSSTSQRDNTSMNTQTVSQAIYMNATPNTKFDQFTSVRLQKNIIIAKKLALVVMVFGVCCLPYEICTIANAICKEKCTSNLAWDITENIQWANSGINPILYAFTIVQFKKNFVRLFRCRSN
ncbi:histamine H3 receptor-like [Strongylocentrotus purpuratus]|uniref:G-protein coupled receptors family 1 profile domain-containing protein n=1 Tax=Strongylocentrotus purpuratus TaxID=7668 RepID=A0A7M7PSE4_STRPU|nr:histamine H3 receptor-like [Strongylocentrotus purpuratus]